MGASKNRFPIYRYCDASQNFWIMVDSGVKSLHVLCMRYSRTDQGCHPNVANVDVSIYLRNIAKQCTAIAFLEPHEGKPAMPLIEDANEGTMRIQS